MKSSLIAAIALIGVTYIGRAESYEDRIYGTGLHFVQGQTRPLSEHLASQFLRHVDQFERAELTDPGTPEDGNAPPLDDTEDVLAATQKAKDKQVSKQQELQMIYDQIATMGKASLVDFAMTNYRQTISMRDSAVQLRAQVTGFVDQYGAV